MPLGEALEVWRTRVTNERLETARLSLVSAIEFCLWDANDDATNFQRNYSIGEVEVVDGVIYHRTEYRERRNHFAYFACSEPQAGFDTSRDAFLGPYRGWDRPLAIERGAPGNSIAHGWQPIGSHWLRLELAPGETKEIVFVLGYAENPVDRKFDPPGSQTLDKRRVRPTIREWLDPGRVERAFEELRADWRTRLDALQVDTGNEHVDRMVNTWNAYQCMVTFNLSRSASMFESGIGRGMGFRDSNQDLLGFVHMAPDLARQRILDIAATQLPNGGAYHQYQPLTKRGNDALGSGFNDDPAWLVLAVAAYLKETGDAGILDEPLAFDNVPGSEQSLYVHLQRAIEYTLERLGPHGLPLIGRADWNDCLNLNAFSETPGESFQTVQNRTGGSAESVFIAGLFVLAAGDLAEIAARRGDAAEATRCRSAAAAMVAAIDDHGWDGDWFRRAYDFFGSPVGSAQNDEGQIFVEPQGICVMAGVGVADGRARRALDSVDARLATPHGVVLQQPAYTRYRVELGEISSYPPGYKENAGVFCHTNPWLMIALAILGDGERALDYYLRINPSARESISDVHRCEPYVYAQMIAGRDAPTHGEAKNSWLTGTAAWNLVAITQWILGIRPEHDGLRIAPVLPASWPGYRGDPAFPRRLPRDPRPARRPRQFGAPDRRWRTGAGLARAVAAARHPGGPRRGRSLVTETGDYHGLPTIRLASPHLWVEVLAAAGPRIVRFGLDGDSTNALAETPGIGWQTPHGRYELFGGHRLWFAPEDPDRVAVPDDAGLVIQREDEGLRLIGRMEPGTGLVRTIAVQLSPTGPTATVRHELANHGSTAIELAPWSITQLPLGGRVILPQRPAVHGHAVRPNRAFVLWPYTSWDDPRLTLRDGVVVWTPSGQATSRSASSTTRAGSPTSARGQRLSDGSGRPPGGPTRTWAATSRRTAGRATSSSSCSGRSPVSNPVRPTLMERWQVAEADAAASLPTCRSLPRELAERRLSSAGPVRPGSGESRTRPRPRRRRGRARRSRCGPGAGESGSGRAPRHEPGSRTGRVRGFRAGRSTWRSAASQARQHRSGRVEVTASTLPAALQPRDSAAQDGRTRSTKRPMRRRASSSCSYEVA